MINITFNGEQKRQYKEGTTYYEISKDCHLKRPILGVKINNEVVFLDKVAKDGQVLEFFDITDINGYIMYKSAIKMIFELALKRTFVDLQVSYDHSITNGMLGTIVGNHKITDMDIDRIKFAMDGIIHDNILFKKLAVRKKEAIKYYEKINQFEKANNIGAISDQTITMYQLDNLLNYYYTDMPYSTGAIENYEFKYIGNNKIVFIWPSKENDFVIPEYTGEENIIKAFDDGKKWLRSLRMLYVSNLNNVISKSGVRDFINSSEIFFNLNISKIAENIINMPEKKFILIAGPSSSGKTTTCKRLSEYLSAMGYNPIKISTDDYFVGRELTPKDKDGNYDYECLEAIDVKLFNEHIVKLLNHEKVSLPMFNFMTGKREQTNNVVELKDNSIILIEGLHCLNDKLLPSVDNSYKYKIYLSPFIPLNIDRHNYISNIDLRLIRRIVRDNRDRSSDVSATIKSWQVVRNGEEKYIFPFIPQADVIVNTALPYELGVLKVYIEPLLHSVGIESPYYEEAKRLLNFLKQFFPIPGDYVNSNSILREFIGGRAND